MKKKAKPPTDLEMMSTPDLWPNLMLPLKKTGPAGWPICGILLGSEPVVYLGNIWMLDNLDTCPKEQFRSFKAMIDAGWRVD